MDRTSELLSLIGEIKGRIEELEDTAKHVESWPIQSPMSFEEDGVENLTSTAWKALVKDGLDKKVEVARYTPVAEAVQFAAPSEELTCSFETFELSSLHSTDKNTVFGLRCEPKCEPQPWLTFEFISARTDLAQYEWFEFILKVSSDIPHDFNCEVICDGAGDDARIKAGKHHIDEFASFIHARVHRSAILEAGGAKGKRLRFMLGTGGKIVNVSIYGLAVFGKRSNLSE